MKILTRKAKMSQLFDKEGKVTPVTFLKLEKPLGDGAKERLLGKKVAIRARSKGKGFTGVMKRWGFSGHPATHGHFSVQRKGGSIGVQGEGRVMPGKKMPGRAGGKKIFLKGLKVVKVDEQAIVVAGCVPGYRGGKVELSLSQE